MSDEEKSLMIYSMNMLNIHIANMKIMYRYMRYTPEQRERGLKIIEELCDFMSDLLGEVDDA